MKRLLSIFIVALCTVTSVSQAAVNIKKAAPVATKKADTVESATSLLPSVIGLVSGVKNLNAQQQQLSADCAPTSDEIKTVNDLVKEWAKLGETTAEEAVRGVGDIKCPEGTSYESFMKLYAGDNESCYEVFDSDADQETVWVGFPKVTSASVCDIDNAKNCKTVHNIYQIFGKIPFSTEDYTVSESKKIAKLIEKSQRCAPEKIAAAKRELYGGFLTQTLSGVGQSTGAAGTSAVLDAVSSMGGSGDVKSMLPSLGQMALQTFDK